MFKFNLKNIKIYYVIPIVLILSLLVCEAQEQFYYKIDLKYKEGTIKIKNIQLEKFLPGEEAENPLGFYSVAIISKEDEVLDAFLFDIPLELRYDLYDPEIDRINGGGVKYLTETEVTIKIPYYPNAKEMQIYDEEFNLLLTKNIEKIYPKPKTSQRIKEFLKWLFKVD